MYTDIIIEKCPKCGGEISNLVLTSYPPIYKKICNSCHTEWTKKSNIVEQEFNPEKEGYVEITCGSERGKEI